MLFAEGESGGILQPLSEAERKVITCKSQSPSGTISKETWATIIYTNYEFQMDFIIIEFKMVYNLSPDNI